MDFGQAWDKVNQDARMASERNQGGNEMTDEVLNAKLAEAREKINALPADQRGPLLALVEETRQRHVELKKNFSRVHEAVDEWRLLMKYLIFDREATRRELDQLRKRLDDSEPS